MGAAVFDDGPCDIQQEVSRLDAEVGGECGELGTL